jgi:hypothetical protein
MGPASSGRTSIIRLDNAFAAKQKAERDGADGGALGKLFPPPCWIYCNLARLATFFPFQKVPWLLPEGRYAAGRHI